MPKRTEDEIQDKLVELELAMKAEKAAKKAEKADQKIVEASREADNMLMKVDAKDAGLSQTKDEAALSVELYHFGGIASLAVGILMVLSHIHVGIGWGAFYGAGGLMLLPLFVGMGMLIYNYRSRIAQLVTVGSLGLVVVSVISRMTLGFYGLSLLDLILLALPVCAGVALLAKANDKKRQLREQTKLLK